jgi:hypothetical protein
MNRVTVFDPADDAAVRREGHDVVASNVQVVAAGGRVVAKEGIEQPEELHDSLVLEEAAEGEGGREGGREGVREGGGEGMW